ncbi:5-oxoprolinase [Cryptococcus neoformans C23]|uniref:5-oxoprolinase n=3 Tax=Cryptococcus neoformans species complex TaxID=1897064 RepID=J9VJH3_CRYN9|nr:5-oxoprolinase [Cryptococcus neoformans var. grubii H99]AUB24288.1 5-oxoprolinase [Cryptococcus neoformans var. grubii]OWZ32068.1 5-oxoprolinase [Cryptococcus neoformans var. grubii AD2-60a]OWZ44736.1 5-oxoprolinase [Cryptococcus neoformans var. grubii C23]OXC85244.1 5-oxoprolinase [Cryptococcus neoformans var. grubii AD1-7a]AFR94607.2 5-oxoprolinase [Cryptococcus neoformans var. grubii H99]|eukprot:XP_012048895.1 5-oxoprolinase [Cryptococcus neoformans var. grubii H99]
MIGVTLTSTVSDHSIRIAIDRGGTFTDVHASWPGPNGREESITKLLSQDPSNYKDAPTEGIRRVLETVLGKKVPRGSPLPTNKIDTVRLSTTVATNALLERHGSPHALLITKGFKDLLSIGNQARPRIFDLNIKKASYLYGDVIEVDERVTLVGYTSDPHATEHAVKFLENGEAIQSYSGEGVQHGVEGVRGMSGEAVQVLQALDEEAVEKDLKALFEQGYRSIAVVLAHSFTFPDHELAVGRIAEKIGFHHISLSSQLLPMIRMVPRGVSTTADAYLTPVLGEYLDGFYSGFEGGKKGNLNVEFMGSDGGLVDLKNFTGLKSILSGPAGGVVGYALTSWDEKKLAPVIGFDVGGTSTDVSRFDGKYEIVYETTTAGISIQSPQLDINTVAAGGGSCLTFRNGMFHAGPESAGAHPGPACYRKGGPLALTDANLILGRLVPRIFPQCFGPNENEPLDPSASQASFEKMQKQIALETGAEMSLDDMIYGFVTIANEMMARPIRTLTEARGFATSKHILASFGGAGGQHACEIAESLGITSILIHRYSSILSAYGLALADRVYEEQEPCSAIYHPSSLYFTERLDKIGNRVSEELARQGFTSDQVKLARMLHMRFDGSDTALMISEPADGDFEQEFYRVYKHEFGFLLESKVIVDDFKVRGIGKSLSPAGESVFSEISNLSTRRAGKPTSRQEVFVSQPGSTKGERMDTPVYELDQLNVGDIVEGPALVIDATQTIFINITWSGTVTSRHLLITRPASAQ